MVTDFAEDGEVEETKMLMGESRFRILRQILRLCPRHFYYF